MADARFPGAFAYVSDVNETMGNFQKAEHMKSSGNHRPNDLFS